MVLDGWYPFLYRFGWLIPIFFHGFGWLRPIFFSWFWMVDTHIFPILFHGFGCLISIFFMVLDGWDPYFFMVLDVWYPYFSHIFFHGFGWLIPIFFPYFFMVLDGWYPYFSHTFSWFWMVETHIFSWFWMFDTHIFPIYFFMVLDGWYPYFSHIFSWLWMVDTHIFPILFHGFGWLIPIFFHGFGWLRLIFLPYFFMVLDGWYPYFFMVLDGWDPYFPIFFHGFGWLIPIFFHGFGWFIDVWYLKNGWFTVNINHPNRRNHPADLQSTPGWSEQRCGRWGILHTDYVAMEAMAHLYQYALAMKHGNFRGFPIATLNYHRVDVFSLHVKNTEDSWVEKEGNDVSIHHLHSTKLTNCFIVNEQKLMSFFGNSQQSHMGLSKKLQGSPFSGLFLWGKWFSQP